MAKPLWPALLEEPIRIDVPVNSPWEARPGTMSTGLIERDQNGGAPAMIQRRDADPIDQTEHGRPTICQDASVGCRARVGAAGDHRPEQLLSAQPVER